MLGKLNSKEIEEVLQSQIVGRIGCYANDTVYVVPISYAYDGADVYGHSKEGFKINLMRTNPAVCFEVEEMKDMANWKSVITWGEYEEIIEKEERDKALKVLLARLLPLISSETTHLSPHWPFPPTTMDAIKGIVFRIRLRTKTGRFENNGIRPGE